MNLICPFISILPRWEGIPYHKYQKCWNIIQWSAQLDFLLQNEGLSGLKGERKKITLKLDGTEQG